MLIVVGTGGVTFVMVLYALERRQPSFVLAFAYGCLLASAYAATGRRPLPDLGGCER